MKDIVVVERCLVDYINEEEPVSNTELYANRTVSYETDKDTLLEALADYTYNWDVDNVTDCNDDFDGECLDSEIISIMWED